METITIKNLKKSFTTQGTDIVVDHAARPTRTRTVLSDVSLEFPVGEISVLLGRSGCGKSTLLKLIAGQEQPDEGEICLPYGWRSALLSPDPYVITWTSVLRNVAMSAGAGRTPEERMELAEKLVRLVHLEEYTDLTPMELSTGMRQRLGIARVLASQSQLLLLDEPFASLDFITRGEMQQQLLDVQQAMPRTMILVTHQLEEALLLGSRIYVMHALGETEEFDLSPYPHPRDMESPAMQSLKNAITESCKR